MHDLPIAPLFGTFSSPCKEKAKPKGELDQNFFIMERNNYNSFTSNIQQSDDPMYIYSLNGRHLTAADATKSSAVFSVACELFWEGTSCKSSVAKLNGLIPIMKAKQQGEVTIKKTCFDASLNMSRPEILANAINQVNNNKGKAPMCYYQDSEDLMVENQEDGVEVQDINIDNDSDNDTI
nr:13689_t:CDS:2 [Entrophospora candida]